jgi:hypothetical protein
MKKKDIEQLGLLYEYVVGRSTSQSRKNGITISTGGGGFKPPPPDDYDRDPGDDEDDGDGDDDENSYENGVYDRTRPKSRKAYNTLKEFLHSNTNEGMSIAEFHDLFNTIYAFFNFAKVELPKDKYYQKNVEAMLDKAAELPCFVKGFKRINLEPDYETDMLYKVAFRKRNTPRKSDRESSDEKRGGRENDPYTPIPADIFASEIPKGLYANYGNNKKYAAQAELHKGLGPGHSRSLDERYEMPIKEFLSILRRIWGPEFNSEFKIGPDDEKYQEKVTAAIRRVEKLPSFYLAKFKPDFDKGIIYRVNYTGEYKE